MNKQTTHYSHTTSTIMPPTVHQAHQLRLHSAHSDTDTACQPQKFTPASRSARIQSWQQRMQGLFSRQAY